ncbi:DUF1801 domain-containing protein [Devosia sp. XK-2]|uniref:DUF1801 domain-containing protein n=1 Tax=Devosia sp. XK-2 TaxID=3126689 RepID=UPI0030CCAF5D
MTLDEFRQGLDPGLLAAVDTLREIILAADGNLTESIKWNAPSFAKDGADRITLGLERRGGVRLVLHRGAKVQNAEGFTFADPEGLARWSAPDRGIAVFADKAAVEHQRQALLDLCRRWLALG